MCLEYVTDPTVRDLRELEAILAEITTSKFVRVGGLVVDRLALRTVRAVLAEWRPRRNPLAVVVSLVDLTESDADDVAHREPSVLHCLRLWFYLAALTLVTAVTPSCPNEALTTSTTMLQQPAVGVVSSPALADTAGSAAEGQAPEPGRSDTAGAAEGQASGAVQADTSGVAQAEASFLALPAASESAVSDAGGAGAGSLAVRAQSVDPKSPSSRRRGAVFCV